MTAAADRPRDARSASLSTFVPALVAVLLASAAVMWAAAVTGNRLLSMASAGAFGTSIVLAALWTNARLWSGDRLPERDRVQADAMRRNARLAALVYAWGAIAMYAIYGLAALSWRHGWQYGTGMALISVLFLAYVHAMRPASTLRQPDALRRAAAFTVVHGLGALAALAFLLASGKLATAKGDWAANHVFLAGGAAVTTLCMLTLVTYARLARAPASPAGSA